MMSTDRKREQVFKHALKFINGYNFRSPSYSMTKVQSFP